LVTYIARQECEKRKGGYRENGAGEYRDPLHARKATDRHQSIQRFMLANDTATIAVEVPIWLHPKEAPDLGLTAPVTGHIDFLQVRYDHLCVLDYKPDAKHETNAKYQTYLYARALSVRTGIPFEKIHWAYFDDKDYYAVSAAK
jgi:ATP-dependent exoDNAse (exonuclease V) beta subunit